MLKVECLVGVFIFCPVYSHLLVSLTVSFLPFLPLFFYLSTTFHILSIHPCIHPAKQPQQRSVSLNLSRVEGGGVAFVPGSPARELSRLVQLQRDKLQALESRLLGCEAELGEWEEAAGEANEVRKNHSYQCCYLQKK